MKLARIPEPSAKMESHVQVLVHFKAHESKTALPGGSQADNILAFGHEDRRSESSHRQSTSPVRIPFWPELSS